MKIITLAKTKELLGITDTSLDTEIARYITIIDAKVKLMTHNKYNFQIYGDVTLDSVVVPISGMTNVTGGINNYHSLDTIMEYIEVGSLITGDNIAADTYIDEVYMSGSTIPTIDLSAVATATEASIIITVGINIGLQPTIAKGIAWLIGEENQNTPLAGLLSRSIGPTRMSWSVSQSVIDGRSGMPSWFVKSFPVYMSGH